MTDETKLAMKEVVPLEVLRPVGTNEQIIKAWKDFQALKTVLLTEEDFYSPGQGKLTIRKSGWRKMAVAFGLNFHPKYTFREGLEDMFGGNEKHQVREGIANGVGK